MSPEGGVAERLSYCGSSLVIANFTAECASEIILQIGQRLMEL